jgi:pSer/pThr/pTyr-binding forkhead associated (FHA) protein
MIKICDCGESNPSGALFCSKCKEDISRLSPVEEPEPGIEAVEEIGRAQAANQSATPAKTPNRSGGEAALTILAEGGLEIGKARDGDIIGRAEVGSDYLLKFPTVSRKHIQVFRKNGAWRLKNMSDNGTFLNGQEVPQNGEMEINMGDELKLSTKCRLTVL